MSVDIKVEMARKHGLVEVEFRREVHTGDICLRDLRVQMAFKAMGESIRGRKAIGKERV